MRYQYETVCERKNPSSSIDDKTIGTCISVSLQLVLTTSNKLYTWGSSPQALRLATQARKRAKSSNTGKGGSYSKFSSILRSGSKYNGTEHTTSAAESSPSETKTPQSTEDANKDETETTTGEESSKQEDTERQTNTSDPSDDESAAGQSTDASIIIPEIKITDDGPASNEKLLAGNEADEKATTNSGGDDAMEHLFPLFVDTSLVEGRIVKVRALKQTLYGMADTLMFASLS